MARKKPAPRNRTAAADDSGQLRLIGGDWRRRVVRFPAVDGVRPTPDRVRETLFNWLMPELPGSRCLDLFAGSGALGLEALSRGASQTVFVDQSRPLGRALEDNLKLLNAGADNRVVKADCLAFLQQSPEQPFHIAFLDPPYNKGWIEPLCEALETRGWLADNAMVYVEHERDRPQLSLPAGWNLHRQKEAGQVCYSLYRVRAGSGGA